MSTPMSRAARRWRTAGIVALLAGASASLLTGCTGTRTDVRQGLQAIADASGSSSFAFVRDSFGELLAVVDTPDGPETWVRTSAEVSQNPDGAEPWWQADVPSAVLTLDEIVEAMKVVPDCEGDLTRTITPVGEGHHLVTADCSGPEESVQKRLPAQYFDGKLVRSGAVDLLDESGLAETIVLAREVVGGSELSSVTLTMNVKFESVTLLAAAGTRSTSANGDPCVPAFVFQDTITETSGDVYRTTCGDRPLPNPAHPFDAELALELWRGAGGESAASGGSIRFEVDPESGVETYLIKVGEGPWAFFDSDGAPTVGPS